MCADMFLLVSIVVRRASHPKYTMYKNNWHEYIEGLNNNFFGSGKIMSFFPSYTNFR